MVSIISDDKGQPRGTQVLTLEWSQSDDLR